MLPRGRFSVFTLFLTGVLLGAQALAQNKGQDDLDRALEVKLTATTLSDLGEVIRLCRSALEKGLNEESTQFAKQLLAATWIQRGTRIVEEHLSQLPLDPGWPDFRRIALEDLEKGLEFDPQQPHVLLRIAQLHVLPRGDLKRAAEALDEAIRLSEDEPKLRAQALTLRAALRQEPEKKLSDLSEAVQASPSDAGPVRLRGALYAGQGKYDLALADFDAALELDPDHAPTLEARAKVLIELKRYDEAMESLDKARQLAPKSAALLIEKARIYGLQSKFEAALEALQQAYLLDPADPIVLLLRATIYQELGKDDKALKDVDEVLKLRPGLPPAVRLRGILLARSGEFDQAAAQLEELRKADPDDVDLNLHLAIFYSAAEKPRKAADRFSTVLKQQPDNLTALRGRGDALLGIGKQAEAVADYEKALKLQPDDTGVLNNLAWVLATSPDEKLRDGKRAIELATKACELTDHKQAHILSTLAAGYAETGDFETAIQWSQKAVELGKEDQRDVLAKELETYRAGEPFRELLTKPESEEQQPPEVVKPEKPEPPGESEPPEKPKAEAPKRKPDQPPPAPPDKPKPAAQPEPEPEPSQPAGVQPNDG